MPGLPVPFVNQKLRRRGLDGTPRSTGVSLHDFGWTGECNPPRRVHVRFVRRPPRRCRIGDSDPVPGLDALRNGPFGLRRDGTPRGRPRRIPSNGPRWIPKKSRSGGPRCRERHGNRQPDGAGGSRIRRAPRGAARKHVRRRPAETGTAGSSRYPRRLVPAPGSSPALRGGRHAPPTGGRRTAPRRNPALRRGAAARYDPRHGDPG